VVSSCNTYVAWQSGVVLAVWLGDIVRLSAMDVTGGCGGGGGGGGSVDDVLRGPGDSTPESAWSSTTSVRVFAAAESHQTPLK